MGPCLPEDGGAVCLTGPEGRWEGMGQGRSLTTQITADHVWLQGVCNQLPQVCAPVCSVTSVVPDSATLRTVALQAPLSTGFSKQEYCSGLPCLPPRDLLHWPAASLPLAPSGKP